MICLRHVLVQDNSDKEIIIYNNVEQKSKEQKIKYGNPFSSNNKKPNKHIYGLLKAEEKLEETSELCTVYLYIF